MCLIFIQYLTVYLGGKVFQSDVLILKKLMVVQELICVRAADAFLWSPSCPAVTEVMSSIRMGQIDLAPGLPVGTLLTALIQPSVAFICIKLSASATY